MPQAVRITDVSPRDGLQNEPGVIASGDKARLIAALAASGVDEVEAASFVSPRWVPQLADAAEVLAIVAQGRGAGGPPLAALVPNEAGLAALLAANEQALARTGRRVVDRVSVFTAASETFSRRNTNASIDETFARFAPVAARARGEGLALRVYVSCAFGCPFEGAVDPAAVARVVGRARALLGTHRPGPNAADAGGLPDEVSLGDTIGRATPEGVGAIVAACSGPEGLNLHLHDTFGLAAACARAGLDVGVRSFDGAVGGLGGCPYASTPTTRAPGNLRTETLVRVVREAGYACGVDEARLHEAAALAAGLVSAARAAAGASPA